MEEKQPWITCYLTDILITYIQENFKGQNGLDYPALFKGIEGFETPSNPEAFLRDLNNWVPLTVLREVELQCERITGMKDVAYHAAKTYFTPGKRQLPSLFEIIVQVLNDARSALIFADLWGSSQSNYLKLQSFEKQGASSEFYILAQFDENARPSVGAINVLRGFCEGFPRLYPFNEETRLVEELLQLHIEDVTREFPDYSVTSEGNSLIVSRQSAKQATVEAAKVSLKTERIDLSHEFMQNPPDAIVVSPRGGRIEVLTQEVDSNQQKRADAPYAYQIVKPGILSAGALSYSFEKGRIYNAPYSRFRVLFTERPAPEKKVHVDDLRREISKLLYEHMNQARQAHVRMVQFNVEKRRLTLENIRLRQEIGREYSFAGIIGQSEKMQNLFGVVRSIAGTDVTVLIQGETGTGKELIARAIHYNSPRKAKRFVAINCGALSETLLESELFGHEKGAFTGATNQRKGIFEIADGGTLFLDEVEETTPNTQVRLLRVLQEGELQRVGGNELIKVEVRIIAATNQNLEELVKAGRFRQDLYYRLNVFPILLPPLRDRTEDIPLLVSHFIEKGKARMNKDFNGVTPQAMALLIAYKWPGNVRELENTIQRMMVIAKGEFLDVSDLPVEIRGRESESKPEPKDLKEIARESSGIVEKRAIVDALSKTGGNVTRAAKALGVSRATLQNKMKLYGLRGPKE